jgi:L-malate glycosyltransferase
MNTPTKIKLLVLPSWYPPRGGDFFREHSMALAAEGLDVTVLACIETSIRKHGLPAWMWGKGIPKITDYNDMNPGSFSEFRRLYRTIPTLYKANVVGWIRHTIAMAERWIHAHGKPDLIQVHSSIWAGVAAARIKQKFGIPYVITEHRSRFVYNTSEARQMFLPWHFPLIKEALDHASQVVTVSDSLQAEICAISPTHINSILSIPNMVDTSFFKPSLKPVTQNPFVFFSLAHLEPVKGFDTLIDAMHILTYPEHQPTDGIPHIRSGLRSAQPHPPNEIPHIRSGLRSAQPEPTYGIPHIRSGLRSAQPQPHLIIGGDGSQRSKLTDMVASYGLQDVVTFKGALTRQQVKEQLHAAHAFVLPSRFEAFGVVFIEAMACGLPVIAARAGGPESFITPACGMIVNPDKPRELAQAMLAMMQDYNNFSHDAIWRHTINMYSPKAIAGQYVELYQRIL